MGATFELHKQRVDGCEIAQAAVALVRAAAKARNVDVVCETSQPLELMADAKLLKKALVTLLDNAIKYSPPGSHVRIDVARTYDTSLRFEVRDHGLGIADEKMHAVSQPLPWPAEGSVRVAADLGQDLAHVRAVVERHGGELSFKTGVGKGTTFFFELPTRLSSRSDEPTHVSRMPLPTALIIESDPLIAAPAMECLMQHRFRVLQRDLLSEALEVVAETNVDLVVLGLKLRDGLGLEGLWAMRECEQAMGAPAVVFGARDEELTGHPVLFDWLITPPMAASAAAAAGRLLQGRLPGRRVLVADDDARERGSICAQLESFGARCTPTLVQDVVARTQRNDFDLIVASLAGEPLDVTSLQRSDGTLRPLLVGLPHDLSSDERLTRVTRLSCQLAQLRTTHAAFPAALQHILRAAVPRARASAA